MRKTIKQEIRDWRQFGVLIEMEDGVWHWSEDCRGGEWTSFSAPFNSFDACLADVQENFGNDPR